MHIRCKDGSIVRMGDLDIRRSHRSGNDFTFKLVNSFNGTEKIVYWSQPIDELQIDILEEIASDFICVSIKAGDKLIDFKDYL